MEHLLIQCITKIEKGLIHLFMTQHMEAATLIPRAGLLWYTGSDGLGPRAYYGSEEFGIPCTDISPDFFDFDKQDPEWLYRGSYPGHYCGHDYGGDRFGGTSSSIVNEREDLSVMASFTHTLTMELL